MRDRLIIEHFMNKAWALHEPVLRNLAMIICRHASGMKLEANQVVHVVNARETAESSHPGAASRVDVGEGGYSIIDGIAVIPITGVLAHHASQVNGISEPQGTSCEEIGQTLTHAFENPAVKAILLDCDSPGGSVEGIATLSDMIFGYCRENGSIGGKTKTIIGQADEMAASAMYWLLAQCNAIYVPETGAVGSIGVYTVLSDISKWVNEEAKTTVHVVKAGEHKGDGVPGTPITPEQLADVQRLINSTYDVFVAHVARGLGISIDAARTLADGRIHLGQAAVDLGLADGVQSFDDTLSQMIDDFSSGTRVVDLNANHQTSTGSTIMPVSKRISAAASAKSNPSKTKGKSGGTAEDMEDDTHCEETDETTEQSAEEEEEKTAAKGKSKGKSKAKAEDPVDDEEKDEDVVAVDSPRHFSTLKAAFPNDLPFAAAAFEQGLTLTQAKAMHKTSSGNKPAASASTRKPLQTAGKVAGRRADDADEAAADQFDSGDPITDFSAAVAAEMKINGNRRTEAVKTVAKRDPDLHTAYLEATNGGRKQRELIADRHQFVTS